MRKRTGVLTTYRALAMVFILLCHISFEVYLVHYMFCVGPVKLFGCTGWWGIDAVLVTAISVFLGSVLHVAARKILGAIDNLCARPKGIQ